MHDDDAVDDDFEFEERGPSKSQRKREALALQDAGEKLVELTVTQLNKIPLPPELRKEIDAARAMTQRGARKRQLQYIGKVMRQVDAEPILTALADLEAGALVERRKHHDLEKLCAALVEGDEEALNGLVERHPAADRQRLRTLIRNAQREAAAEQAPKSRRELFRYLRELGG